jgi:hypothetical protein
MNGALSAKAVVYDFGRPMRAEGDANVNKGKRGEYGDAIIKHMG